MFAPFFPTGLSVKCRILHCPGTGHSVAVMDDAGSSAQRIRIGLTGLAFAFLLVLLGSAISRSGEEAERVARTPAENQAINEAEALEEAEPDEPLAKLGVAPGGSDTANNSSTAD